MNESRAGTKRSAGPSCRIIFRLCVYLSSPLRSSLSSPSAVPPFPLFCSAGLAQHHISPPALCFAGSSQHNEVSSLCPNCFSVCLSADIVSFVSSVPTVGAGRALLLIICAVCSLGRSASTSSPTPHANTWLEQSGFLLRRSGRRLHRLLQERRPAAQVLQPCGRTKETRSGGGSDAGCEHDAGSHSDFLPLSVFHL